MKVIFASTKPSRFDSKWIAKAKWLQEQDSPTPSAGADTLVFSDTIPRGTDGQTVTIQKILQKLHE